MGGSGGGLLELTLRGAECSPSEKEKEPQGVDPFAVLHYGSQHWTAKLIKDLKFAYRLEPDVNDIVIKVYDGNKPEPREVIATVNVRAYKAILEGSDSLSCPIVKSTGDTLGHLNVSLKMISDTDWSPPSQSFLSGTSPVPGVNGPSPPAPPHFGGSSSSASGSNPQSEAIAAAAAAGAAAATAIASVNRKPAKANGPPKPAEMGYPAGPPPPPPQGSAPPPYPPPSYPPTAYPGYSPYPQQYYPPPYPNYYGSSYYPYPYPYGYYSSPPTTIIIDDGYGYGGYGGYGGGYGGYGGYGGSGAGLGAGLLVGGLGGLLLGDILF